MEELSLNILDIAMNSVAAGAENISILIDEDEEGIRTLTISDDGKGMSEEFLKNVTDPFTTSRTTRKVGLGLPFLKLAAEQSGGTLNIASSQGEDHGTTVTATFDTKNIDCPPLGDVASTIVTLIQGSPEKDFLFRHTSPGREVSLSTKEMREILGDDVPLDSPEILSWAASAIREGY